MATKKPVRKSAKKETKTKETAKETAVENKPVQNTTFISKSPRNKIIILLGILLIAALVYLFKNLFIVAFVNGQPISRIAVIKELEKQNGKQVLDYLVTKTLILQEAKKKNITVSKNEIDKELQNIEKTLKDQGQNLDQVLALRGMTKNDLTEQIVINKSLEKILGNEVSVSDQEVNDYIEKNKITFPEGTNPEEGKANIKEQLKQQKLNEKRAELLQNLQKNAKINYFINY